MHLGFIARFRLLVLGAAVFFSPGLATFLPDVQAEELSRQSDAISAMSWEHEGTRPDLLVCTEQSLPYGSRHFPWSPPDQAGLCTQTANTPTPQPSPRLFLDTTSPLLAGLRFPDASSDHAGEWEFERAETQQAERQAPFAKDLFVRVQPYYTKDQLEASWTPLGVGEHYHRSPLNATDKVYGLGILADYKVASWLHLNSSYRFNVHESASAESPASTHNRGATSHTLFLGVSIPFSPSSDDD